MHPDDPLDDLNRELAGRFAVLSRLFDRLATPDAARELIDALISDDPARFSHIVDDLDLPVLGKCFWVRDIIERVVSTPAGLKEECWLREGLTPEERRLYLTIALRHRQFPQVVASPGLAVAGRRELIPAGAFLDELKANGLVACEIEPTYEVSTVLGFSQPSRVCI